MCSVGCESWCGRPLFAAALVSLANSCMCVASDNPLHCVRQTWNTVQELCKGTPHQSWNTCSRRLTANAEGLSIFTDYLLPYFAHVISGNHCRSDPVQVWSWGEGECVRELAASLVWRIKDSHPPTHPSPTYKLLSSAEDTERDRHGVAPKEIVECMCVLVRESVWEREGESVGGRDGENNHEKTGGRCKVGWATIGVEQPFLSTMVLGFWGEARWREQIAKEVAIARSDGRRLVLSNQVWAPLCSVSLWCRVCGMRVKSRKDGHCEVWVWEQGPPPLAGPRRPRGL